LAFEIIFLAQGRKNSSQIFNFLKLLKPLYSKIASLSILYLYAIASKESHDFTLYGIPEVAGIFNFFQGFKILFFKLLYILIVSHETQNFEAITEMESHDFTT
jgi:hypothetical protein